MPKYTYPVIFIYNKEAECYNGYVPDLAIFADGQTPEEVYADLEEILNNYMFLATKYKTEIPEPSTLEVISSKWPGYKVSLITATVK